MRVVKLWLRLYLCSMAANKLSRLAGRVKNHTAAHWSVCLFICLRASGWIEKACVWFLPIEVVERYRYVRS